MLWILKAAELYTLLFSVEPNVGLELTTLEIKTWVEVKSQMLNELSHPGAPELYTLNQWIIWCVNYILIKLFPKKYRSPRYKGSLPGLFPLPGILAHPKNGLLLFLQSGFFFLWPSKWALELRELREPCHRTQYRYNSIFVTAWSTFALDLWSVLTNMVATGSLWLLSTQMWQDKLVFILFNFH